MNHKHESNVGRPLNAYHFVTMPKTLQRPRIRPDIPFAVQCFLADTIEKQLEHSEWLARHNRIPQYARVSWGFRCVEAVCFADEQGIVSHIGTQPRLSQKRVNKSLVDPGETAVLTGTECPICKRPQFTLIGDKLTCAGMHEGKKS